MNMNDSLYDLIRKIYNIYNYLNLNMKPEGIEIPQTTSWRWEWPFCRWECSLPTPYLVGSMAVGGMVLILLCDDI